MVRGAVVLPHGTGKTMRVLVIAKGDKAKEAKEAGADFAGAEDIVDTSRRRTGSSSTRWSPRPDMMGLVGKLGRVLGPNGLMPNPKVGTVTTDVAKAVRELKAGRVEFRVEKAGIVHARVGKASFGGDKLHENAKALLETLIKLKPQTAKGTYVRSVTLSTTMGPGIKVDPAPLLAAARGRGRSARRRLPWNASEKAHRWSTTLEGQARQGAEPGPGRLPRA